MKKLLAILFLTLSSSLFTFCEAQQEFGQIVINAGVGYSPEFDGEIAFALFDPIPPWYPVKNVVSSSTYYGGSSDSPDFSCSSITPNEGATIDIGIIDWFSIGFAASYQSEIVNWAYFDNNFPGPANPWPFSDKITRTNAAIRLLCHVLKDLINKHFDFYSGFRIGRSSWHDIPNNPTINGSLGLPSTFLSSPNMIVNSFQVLLGVHYYPIKFIGIHVEAGVGSPYLIEGGISFRINTRKTITKTSTPSDTSRGHQINK